jgi:hypothetical protein
MGTGRTLMFSHSHRVFRGSCCDSVIVATQPINAPTRITSLISKRRVLNYPNELSGYSSIAPSGSVPLGTGLFTAIETYDCRSSFP